MLQRISNHREMIVCRAMCVNHKSDSFYRFTMFEVIIEAVCKRKAHSMSDLISVFRQYGPFTRHDLPIKTSDTRQTDFIGHNSRANTDIIINMGGVIYDTFSTICIISLSFNFMLKSNMYVFCINTTMYMHVNWFKFLVM